jgi:hypothetical protein
MAILACKKLFSIHQIRILRIPRVYTSAHDVLFKTPEHLLKQHQTIAKASHTPIETAISRPQPLLKRLKITLKTHTMQLFIAYHKQSVA